MVMIETGETAQNTITIMRFFHDNERTEAHMSASREKKDRKELLSQGLTERQKREQQEASKKRMRTIAYSVVGAVIVVLVAALLIWNSGIIQRNSTALTVNGKRYSPADVSYFYMRALSSAWDNEQVYANYYEQLGLEYTTSFDPQSNLKTQWVDAEKTQSFHDYFLNSAKEALRETVALYDAAMAEGYVLPQEDLDAMEANYESLKSQADASYSTVPAYLKLIYGRIMTESVYRRNVELSSVAVSYYNAKTGAMGDYTDEDIMAYYQENPQDLDSYSFERCYIDGTASNPVDENGEPLLNEAGETVTATEEDRTAAMAAAKAQAEAMVAAVRAGGNFATIAPDYVAQADVETYSQAGATANFTLGNELSSTFYGDWLTDSARKAGDVELFEGSTGYFVVQYNSRELDNTETVDFRHILFMAETDEDATEPTQAQMDAARVKAQNALDTWLSGDEPTAASFGELADELTEDYGSMGSGGLYTKVNNGDMVPGINDWIFDPARKVGDTTLAENFGSGNYYGWHVVYFAGTNVPAWRSIAESNKLSDETSAWLDSIKEGYEVTDGRGLNYVW